jgi:hypothetical protein
MDAVGKISASKHAAGEMLVEFNSKTSLHQGLAGIL